MTRFKRGLCALIASFLLLTTPRVLSLALDAFCKGIMKIRFKKWKIRIAQGLVLLAGSIGILIAHSSGEPSAVTGDFGEPSCNQAFCHSDNPENDGVGSITISGVPAEYVPGTPYPLTVKVNRAGQNMWGFQASARIVSSSLQAGNLVLTDTSRTQITTQSEVQYIQHTSTGTDQPEWSFNWIAPADPVGDIRFSAAGNSANGNFNPRGDFIYTATATTVPQPTSSDPITALFAQAVVGGGFNTVFTIPNTGDTPIEGALRLRDGEGMPFDVDLILPSSDPQSASENGQLGVVGADFALPMIPPGGTLILTANPVNTEDPTKGGWARIESAGGPIEAVATFQLVVGGTLQSIAGVLASQPTECATIPVDNSEAEERFTGFAVANISDGDINITVFTLNEDGAILDQISPPELNPLGPQKQVARFLHQEGYLPSRTNFKGSMVLVVSGGEKFGVVALIQNQGMFTAIPVIPAKAPQIPN